jgi:CheY-like chemotaxis protein
MAHILIIEDDENVRLMLGCILEKVGHRVTAAGDGQEAVRLFEDSVDLVITDMLMPHMGGLETIEILRQRVAGLPTIGMSGGGQVSPQEYLNVAALLGADRTITKPFSHAAILEIVSELLAETAHHSKRAA